MPSVTTIGGWVAIAALGAGYYAFTQNSGKNKRSTLNKQVSKAAAPRKEPKSKKARKEGLSSGGDQDGKQAQKHPKREKAGVEEEPVTYINSSNNEKDEIDNREFARQLSNTKAGTIMASKSQSESRPKSVKQARAQEKKPADVSSDNATAPSSTTGGDADDDESPAGSPELKATSLATPVGGVADMLEKPAPGPSVLRISSPTIPAQPKKSKAPAAFEPAETKKQRQNRKKAEEKKLAREEDEKIRQAQLEKQRRTAREAEGRAAKDGSAFMATKAPTSSAWTASSPSSNGVSKPVQLLDTYEAPRTTTSAKFEESKASSSKSQNKPVLSEEDQLALAVAESRDANWEVVKMAKKKTTKKENEAPKDGKQSSADEKSDYSAPPVIKPTGPGQKWGTTLVHTDGNGKQHETETTLQDSEWEVA